MNGNPDRLFAVYSDGAIWLYSRDGESTYGGKPAYWYDKSRNTPAKLAVKLNVKHPDIPVYATDRTADYEAVYMEPEAGLFAGLRRIS